jgi:hypothetical protein
MNLNTIISFALVGKANKFFVTFYGFSSRRLGTYFSDEGLGSCIRRAGG